MGTGQARRLRHGGIVPRLRSRHDGGVTAAFLLVHSPIVGPDTWEPVAEELIARGHHAVVPNLPVDADCYWRSHVEAVAEQAAAAAAPGTTVTVAGHSGAGQLLAPLAPALQQRGLAVEAYLLADAGLPTRGTSRVQQLRAESPAFADELEAVFAAGGRFPDWPDELLAALVPDEARRRRLRAGVRQLPQEYWTEPIPDNPAWPDAPLGVLQFSPGYAPTAAAARRAGWPLRDLDAGNHFLGLKDPVVVARGLVDLRAELLDG